MSCLNETLGEIARVFGLSQREIEGYHERHCDLTGAVCSLCEGPEKVISCQYGKIETFGMTLNRLAWYTARLDEYKIDRVKWLILQSTGKWPDENEPPADSPASHEFPNDVAYLTANQIASTARSAELTLKQWEAKGDSGMIERSKMALWDADRRDACLGAEPVGKRCAMNDQLWARWVASGRTITLDYVKDMVDYNVARNVLLRPGQDASQEPDPEYVETLDPCVVENARKQMDLIIARRRQ